MLFNSIDFMLFFPIVVVLYYVVPKKMKKIWLLVASYYFYMGWNPKYALLIGFSTFITYISAIIIDRVNRTFYDNRKSINRLVVLLCVASNLGILATF